MEKRASKTSTSTRSARRACIIAVGGAKGGIGKSIFATNLAVQLSRLGHRTVVVDLDLGGANQHLYLGHRALLPSTVNDFVRGRARTLDDVAVETRFGPRLIGGNSSELGSANLPFGRKLKLLRGIRAVDADFVVLDLGGDTSYNIVDCFNIADLGIVVTTRESASYIGAYQFIKIALYRKLQRAFGVESRFSGKRDPQLEEILVAATRGDAAGTGNIDDLIAQVEREAPQSMALLQEILADFHPYLVTNRLPRGFAAEPLVSRLQAVLRRWLSQEVPHLGGFSSERAVEASAIDLTPVLCRDGAGRYATEMRAIADRLIAAWAEQRTRIDEAPALDTASGCAESQEDAADETTETAVLEATPPRAEPVAIDGAWSFDALRFEAANDLPPTDAPRST
jgi:flagellar biosynthesis protein FlhG